jgi:hypothetical protein
MTAKLGKSRVWWRINFREGGSNLLVEATVQGMSARPSWLSRQIGAIVGAAFVLWGWREIRL